MRVFRDDLPEFEMLRAGALELGEIVLAENQVYYLAEDRNFHRQNMPELFLYTLGDARATSATTISGARTSRASSAPSRTSRETLQRRRIADDQEFLAMLSDYLTYLYLCGHY